MYCKQKQIRLLFCLFEQYTNLAKFKLSIIELFTSCKLSDARKKFSHSDNVEFVDVKDFLT